MKRNRKPATTAIQITGNTSVGGNTLTWAPYREVTKLDPKYSVWRCVGCRKQLGRDEQPKTVKGFCPRCGCSLTVRVATTKRPRFITVREPTWMYTNCSAA